jgi:hypothetical protein
MAGTAQKKTSMPTATEALPGRGTPMKVPDRHFVNGQRIVPPFPAGLHEAVFAMGCFWGAERPRARPTSSNSVTPRRREAAAERG